MCYVLYAMCYVLCVCVVCSEGKRAIIKDRLRQAMSEPERMLLHVKGLPPSVDFNELRILFARVCDVAWVEMLPKQALPYYSLPFPYYSLPILLLPFHSLPSPLIFF